MRTVMHFLYCWIVRPLWFWWTRHDAEAAHEQGMAVLRFIGRRRWLRHWLQWWLAVDDSRLACLVAGIGLKNPIMLAAGFCKSIDHGVWGLTALGFSGIVGGSITADEEKGNPRPRMFRLTRLRSLNNRMGFNNDGAGKTRLRCLDLSVDTLPIPLGLSIGKSVKVAPNNLTVVVSDYCLTLKLLYEHARWIEINISSPNSKDLRNLQRREYLSELLSAILRYVDQLAKDAGEARRKPVFVKIDPDMSDQDAHDVVEVACKLGAEGIVCTNTTTDQSGLAKAEQQPGGVSGEYLRQRALRRIRQVSALANGRLVIIGVGGIATADHAWEALRAGAHALQIFTALPYEGPLVVNRMLHGLLAHMNKEGVKNIQFLHC